MLGCDADGSVGCVWYRARTGTRLRRAGERESGRAGAGERERGREGERERESGSGSGRAGQREREREKDTRTPRKSKREEGESIGSGRVGVGHAVQVMAPVLHPQQGTLVGCHGLDPVGGEHVALRDQSLVVEVQREVEAVILEHVFRFVVDVVRLLHPVGCHSIHLQRQVVVVQPGVETQSWRLRWGLKVAPLPLVASSHLGPERLVLGEPGDDSELRRH